jgi:hypothetical protein
MQLRPDGVLQIWRPEQTLLQPPGDQPPLVPHPHLAVEGTEVPADAVAPHLLQCRDGVTVMATGDRQEQLLLTVTEHRWCLTVLLQPLAQTWIHQPLALEHQQDRPQQLPFSAGFSADQGIGATAPDVRQTFLRDRGREDDDGMTAAGMAQPQLLQQQVHPSVFQAVTTDQQQPPVRRQGLGKQLRDGTFGDAAVLQQHYQAAKQVPLMAAGRQGPTGSSGMDGVQQRLEHLSNFYGIHPRYASYPPSGHVVSP